VTRPGRVTRRDLLDEAHWSTGVEATPGFRGRRRRRPLRHPL